jgi:hypothetical protein
MKTFTDLPIEQNGMVKPQILNNNIQKYINEWNGNLNGNNLPVYSVETTHVSLGDPDTIISGAVSGAKCPLTTQGYFWKRRSSSFEGGTDVWTPILTLDLKTDDWSKGWNRLSYYSGFEQFDLNFDAREGMLNGCAIIDWQHGTDTLLCQSGDPVINFSGTRGHDWISEWGVFVNNVLVARTGQIPPKRHTTELPFSIPCGSQNINIDVRWISTISDYSTTGTPHGSEFLVFSAELWVRNTVR